MSVKKPHEHITVRLRMGTDKYQFIVCFLHRTALKTKH